ncbi:hypothetical protein TcCL_Unassigned00434 [Trypanosoma cruzi]|nr:hypothetical protein TcCL_Unassigned00434 [Trypanosoma cruzi]
MNASRNILQGKCSRPCKQSRASSTFQQPLLGKASLSFVLVSSVSSSYEMKMPSTSGVIKHLQINYKGFTASRKSIQSGSQRELRNACHLPQPRALQPPQPPTVSSFLVDPNRMVHLDLLGSSTGSRNGVHHARTARDSIISPSTSASPNSVK